MTEEEKTRRRKLRREIREIRNELKNVFDEVNNASSRTHANAIYDDALFFASKIEYLQEKHDRIANPR